jgi:hypothetical protein
MSLESLQTIIGRAVMEPEYRELLFGDPDAALEGYELSEEENSALTSLERETFDEVAGELEERISRAGGAFLLRDASVREPLGRLFGDTISSAQFTVGSTR